MKYNEILLYIVKYNDFNSTNIFINLITFICKRNNVREQSSKLLMLIDRDQILNTPPRNSNARYNYISATMLRQYNRHE
jgi:hypothetical protein